MAQKKVVKKKLTIKSTEKPTIKPTTKPTTKPTAKKVGGLKNEKQNLQRKTSSEYIEKYRKLLKLGKINYILIEGGKRGVLFGILIFLSDYFIWKNVYGFGTYLFASALFGLLMGLWGWKNINKVLKENKTSKKASVKTK